MCARLPRSKGLSSRRAPPSAAKERELLPPPERFQLAFPPERRRSVPVRLAVHQLQRPPPARVARTPACAMRGQSGLHVRSRPCVEGPIPTAQNIDVPARHGSLVHL